MSGRQNQTRNNDNNKSHIRRPPLTHFLCLPLINSISLPQLESSLAEFKSTIPSNEHDALPLIPHDAIRPVGTLHLTLGVMSLPTQERLDEALRFFHSLDLLSLMRLAEEKAAEKRNKILDEQTTPAPLTISLESLHALPRARSATVLHAAPVDHTERLYPFCELLRDRFLEAGFLKADYEKEKQRPTSPDRRPDADATPGAPTTEISVDRKLKPRPLLLHATVANTVYVRGKRRGGGHDRRGGKSNQHQRNNNDRYMFDARDILTHYRNFFLDVDRVTARPVDMMPPQMETYGANDKSGDYLSDDEALMTGDRMYPFVWAKDFPIEFVTICEMGAKKLDPNGLNARLGEKYLSIAERSLDFSNS